MQAADVKVENTVPVKIELDGNTDYENIESLERTEITTENGENTEEILPDCSYKSETDDSVTVKNELSIKFEEYDVDIEENYLGAFQMNMEDLPPTDRISQPEPEKKKREQTKKGRIRRQQIPVSNYAVHKGGKDCLVKRAKKLKNTETAKRKTYRCFFCRKRSPNDQAFLSHINTHCRDLSTVYRCACGEMFNRKADHKCNSKKPLTELQGMYCEFCKKMYSNRFVYMLHAEQHIGQEKKSVKKVFKTYKNCNKKMRSKKIKIEEN